MANIWSTEAWAIVIAACSLMLLGELSGNWFIACAMTSGSYIGWLYYRLLKLEHWIRRGTKVSEVYEDNGFIGIIIRQLYEQKKTHNQRKRRTKRILRRLNQNISALPDATVLLKSDFAIEWCNDPARYLLNLRSPQDLGYKINNLIRNPELQAYLNNPKSREFIELESPVDHRISIQIKIAPIGGEQLLLIARNVSDQKLFRESLKNFVANASHELKSPLTVISGHLELLEAENRLSDSGQASLHTARRQAERMKELIQNLLLLSQVESYQLQPGEGERVPILEVMTNTSAAMDKYADRDRIAWDFPSDFVILGVKAEIEGICINLVENALKYSTPGTPITVSWQQNSQGEYLFTVADQGPGIDAQDMPRVTERYFRAASTASEVAGSGLGLAIVQQAANKHGATLKIDSEPGQSTVFTVVFPSFRCIGEERKKTRAKRLANI